MTGRYDEIEIEVVTSRRALIDVMIGVADHGEALTVLGGHAVIEMTQHIPALPLGTTRPATATWE